MAWPTIFDPQRPPLDGMYGRLGSLSDYLGNVIWPMPAWSGAIEGEAIPLPGQAPMSHGLWDSLPLAVQQSFGGNPSYGELAPQLMPRGPRDPNVGIGMSRFTPNADIMQDLMSALQRLRQPGPWTAPY